MTDLEAMAANAVESAVLGADDVLVLNFERAMSGEEFERVAATIGGGPLKGRVLIVGGGAKMLVARDAAAAG